MTSRRERLGEALLAPPDVQADLGGKAIRGSMATLGGQVLLTGLQLGTTVVLARLLSPRDFGLVAMVAVLTTFLSIFRDLGLTHAVVQRGTVTHRQVSTLFWVNTAVTIVLAALVAALSPVVAWFYGEPQLTSLTAALGAVLVLEGLGALHQAILSRRMRFGALAGSAVAGHATGVAVAITVAVLGGGPWALVALAATRAAAYSGLLWRLSGWQPSRPRRRTGVRDLLRFGGGVSGSSVANFVSRNADNVLIGWRWGAQPLGLYSRAYSLLLQPLGQINAPLSRVAIPTLSRLQSDPERYRRAYLRMLSVSLVIATTMVGFAVVVADLVVAVLLGPGWEGAATIFQWLAVAGITQPLTNTIGWLFVTQARTGEMLRWAVISAALNVAAFAVGLPFGAVGVAAAYGLFGVFLQAPLVVWYVGRTGPVSAMDLGRVVRFPLIVAGLVALAAGACRPLLDFAPAILQLAAAAGAGLIAGIALCLTSSPGRRFLGELQVITRSLRT